VFGFVLAPIVVVMVEAFDASDLMAFPPRHFSLRWFEAFFHDAEFMASLRVSLEIGLLAAAVSTVIGVAAATVLARRGKGQAALETYLLSPLYVPRVLVGLALLLAFARLNMSGSFTGLLLGHVLITFPYAVRTVLVGLDAVEPSVKEAARMLGATPWRVFCRVTLPIVRGAILAGFTFALIVSFSDVYLAIFISGPRTTTLPMKLFTFMEWDQSPLVAAASAIQIVLIVAVVVVTTRVSGFRSPGRVE
jgi:putative spermidine/putrescine transport system permease protein